MPAPLQIQVHDKRQPVYAVELAGPLVFGRQSEAAETPYTHKWQTDHWRVVIAGVDEFFVSRKHVRLESLPGGKVRLANLSTKLAVRLENGLELKPESSVEIDMPVVLIFGGKTVYIQPLVPEDLVFQGLAQATIAPAAEFDVSAALTGMKPPVSGAIDVETLVPWMRITMDVLHSAAGSIDFFARAVRAVVDLVGLDAGRVLLLENGEWKQQTLQTRLDDTELDRKASRQVLGKVQAEKRTFWQVPTLVAGGSLIGINAVVAAPILNRHGEVIGALYGDRGQRGGGGGAAYYQARSHAGGTSGQWRGGGPGPRRAGTGRYPRPGAIRAVLHARAARELTARPELLEGRDLDVSVLVCDIRGFSRVTERLGPRERWSGSTTFWRSCLIAF